MRAPPALQISIVRFGAWRAGVGLLLLAAALAFGAWLWSLDDRLALTVRVVLAGVGTAAIAVGTTLLRCPPMSLRWDTQRWHLGPADAHGDERWSGRLAVEVDLGAWMLLRFVRDDAPRWSRSTWLPVQRRGLEAQWHALRCTVYCARPAQGHDTRLQQAITPESQE